MSVFVDSFLCVPVAAYICGCNQRHIYEYEMNKLLCMMVVLLSLAACTDDTEYTAGVWYRRSDLMVWRVRTQLVYDW